MNSKIFLCFVASLFFVSIAFSQTSLKGSVGAGGSKKYGPFPVEFSGTGLLHLSYENAGSDLDLGISYVGTDGQEHLYASSFSGIRNFEQMQVGVPTGSFFVYVESYQGASPYRLSLDCTCLLSGSGAAGIMATTIKEVPIDDESKVIIRKIRDLQQAIKK
jgi:hypothetical protein